MLTKATKIIKEDRNLLASKNICISSNDINKDYLEYLHVKEQFMFFSPDKVVVNYSLERQPNNIFYISKDCPIYGVGSKTWIKYEYCRNYQKFICPPDKSNYIIYVEKS